jgi:chemotaxis protein CheX
VKTLESAADLVMDSVIDSVRQVIPIPANVQSRRVFKDSIVQSDIGVLVGFTGDVYGRIVIQGECDTFGKIGQSMFGMPLEGELLHSFVGELANMVAGNTSTIISGKGRTIDITPPTVMVGKLHLYGFEQGIAVPIILDDLGEINIILLMQQ